MKRFISILTMVLVCTRAFALNPATFEIKVTINQPPGIESFLPSDGYVITEGDVLTISIDASDPNFDNLQYHFVVKDANGIVRREQAWSTDSSFIYTLDTSDIGLNKITAEVTDGIETVRMQEIEIYVFYRSPALPEGQ